MEENESVVSEENNSKYQDIGGIDDSIEFLRFSGDIKSNTFFPIISRIIELNSFSKKPPVKAICLFVSSCGGDLHETMSLVNVIRASKIPVYTIAMGQVASAGVVLATSGVKRFVAPYSEIMTHNILTSLEGYSKISEIEERIKNFKDSEREYKKYFSTVTRKPMEWVEEKIITKTDKYFTAEEAVEVNLFDDLFKSFNQLYELI